MRFKLVALTLLTSVSLAFPCSLSCFSPKEDCSKFVISFLDRANETLDIAMYSLTKDGISQAVVRAHQRGVKVRVVVDKTQAGLQAADDELLEQSGIVVKRISGMGGGLMHHKFAIIDDETILTGSYNWTDNATSRNSENLNVLCSPIRSYKKEFERLWEKQP